VCSAAKKKEIKMLTILRDYLSLISVKDKINNQLTGNRDVHEYFRAEYKRNPAAAFEYWQSTGKFNFN